MAQCPPALIRLLKILRYLDATKMSQSQIFRRPPLFIIVCLIDRLRQLHHSRVQRGLHTHRFCDG